MSRIRALLFGLVAFALSACATAQRLDAAGDVHALLIAIRDDDRAAFNARVDRRALKLEMETRIRAEGRSRGTALESLAAILAPGLAEIAGDALIQPSVFRAVAEHYGYGRDTRIPSPIYISQALRLLPDGRMCSVARKDGPCLLTFTRGANGHWQLSGFEGDVSMLRLGRRSS